MPPPGFIPAHGGYRDLLSYQKSEVVYDITRRFCDRFLRRGDRTIDQMVQAARSGKQNIAEGSQASGTSKEMELKLVGVARASLEELLNDYLDYLRTHDHALWPKNSKEALFVRRLSQSSRGRASAPSATSHSDPTHRSHRSHTTHDSYETYRTFIETRPAETVANIAICLIHQANYLLDRQLRALEQAFLEDGGIRERMTKARLASRR
ncbi:MAG: four helix bundle protein [Phycisphaerales bacterium]|nr:four helix bundle protein [Phycisphaerales bacterium]